MSVCFKRTLSFPNQYLSNHVVPFFFHGERQTILPKQKLPQNQNTRYMKIQGECSSVQFRFSQKNIQSFYELGK